ncbi:MAG: hypothetical protein WBA93_28680 [Microcoleaceae cyanobacterium]
MIEKPQELKISEIKEKYPKQWVTVDITEKDIYGFPASGKVLLQANNIDLVLEKPRTLREICTLSIRVVLTTRLSKVNSELKYY